MPHPPSDALHWFTDWFDSPYYHLLYSGRNDQEARQFMDRLVERLRITTRHRVLDLACGKGRHAIYLNKRGFDVMGVDLAPSNIAMASWFANERLRFRVHDMRQVVKPGCFHFVLNLFTSFGYFDDPADDQRAMHAAAQNLRPDGRMVLDFMNTTRVIETLVPDEEKVLQGVRFHLKRRLHDGMIVKDIAIEDQTGTYRFQERVRALTYHDFIGLFQAAGLRVDEVAGSYQLDAYAADRSERMIFFDRQP